MFEGYAILDDGRLAEMVGGDEEFIIEILQLYIEATGADVAALARSASAGRDDEVGRLAHTIKGASGNVGADAMMEMARRVEAAVKEGDVTSLAQTVEQMVVLFQTTSERIQTRLNG